MSDGELWDNVKLWARIGDLVEADYESSLLLISLVEVLAERGLISRRELGRKAQRLDRMLSLATTTATTEATPPLCRRYRWTRQEEDRPH